MGRVIQILGLVIVLGALAVYAARRIPVGEAPAPADSAAFPPPPAELGSKPTPASYESPADRSAAEVLRLLQSGRRPEAVSRVEALLADQGETPGLVALDGMVRLAGGEVDPARERFARALELDPGCSLARLGGARIEMGSRRFDRAVEDLQALCRDFPRQPEHWRLLSVARLGAGKPRDALAAAVRALRLNPSSPVLAVAVADCLLRSGREAEARAWYEAAYAAAGPAETEEVRTRREDLLGVLALIEAR
jgi:tetratricopeptide (TPR) repeat protein